VLGFSTQPHRVGPGHYMLSCIRDGQTELAKKEPGLLFDRNGFGNRCVITAQLAGSYAI
jgi:hypothetical protein